MSSLHLSPRYSAWITLQTNRWLLLFLSKGAWQTHAFPVNHHRILDFITFSLNFPDKTNWKFCLWVLTWLLCIDDELGHELTLQMLCKQLQSLGMFCQFWGSSFECENVCLLSACLPYWYTHSILTILVSILVDKEAWLN